MTGLRPMAVGWVSGGNRADRAHQLYSGAVAGLRVDRQRRADQAGTFYHAQHPDAGALGGPALHGPDIEADAVVADLAA